jgi:anti-sigma factor RsiW
MQLEPNDHVTEESLESYALGSLSEPLVTGIEEHLLICPACQDKLREFDDYIAAMRGAAARLDREDESRKTFWTRVSEALTVRRLTWALALMTLALVGLAVRLSLRPPPLTEPFAMVLETSRGAPVQHAPARRPLNLSLDITALPVFPTYQLETVDASGRVQAQSSATASQDRVKTSLAKGLSSGSYFIRLYSPTRELLREYGLQVD